MARQPLFYESDLGRLKVDVLVERCSSQNHHVRVVARDCMLDKDNVFEFISGIDVVVDCSDSAEIAYLLNDACVAKGVPLVAASMSQWSGYCLLVKGRGCYRCLFPVDDQELPSCAGEGVISTLPGLLGAIQANCVLACLLKIDQGWLGKLLRCDVRRPGFDVLSFSSDQSCRICSVLAVSTSNELGLMTVSALDHLGLGNVCLLDVRTEQERGEDNIGGVHIPIDVLPERYLELSLEKLLVVYCRSGVRSEQAGRFLCQKGFDKVSHLCGGLLAWRQLVP